MKEKKARVETLCTLPAPLLKKALWLAAVSL